MPGCVTQILKGFVSVLQRDHIVAFLFKDRCNCLAAIGVIIHQKDDFLKQILPERIAGFDRGQAAPGCGSRRVGLSGRRSDERQSEIKRAPHAHLTLHPDAAAMGLDDAFGD